MSNNIINISKEKAWADAEGEQSQMSKGKTARRPSAAAQIIENLMAINTGDVFSVAVSSRKEATMLRSALTTSSRETYNADQWGWHFVSKVVRIDGGGLKLKFQKREGVSPRRLIEQRKKREREQQQRQYHDSNGRLGVPALPSLPQLQSQQ